MVEAILLGAFRQDLLENILVAKVSQIIINKAPLDPLLKQIPEPIVFQSKAKGSLLKERDVPSKPNKHS